MVSKRRSGHCTPAILTTYPGSITLPKGGSLPRSSTIALLNHLLNPNEPRSAHHCLGISQVCLYAYPVKNSYHGRQYCLYPYRIVSHYMPIVCIKSYAVLCYRLSEPMLSLLGSTDLQEGRPDHCFHYYIEYLRG